MGDVIPEGVKCFNANDLNLVFKLFFLSTQGSVSFASPSPRSLFIFTGFRIQCHKTASKTSFPPPSLSPFEDNSTEPEHSRSRSLIIGLLRGLNSTQRLLKIGAKLSSAKGIGETMTMEGRE